MKLNKYVKIDNNSFSSNTLFNYLSFIEHLNTRRMMSSILKWFEFLVSEDRYYLQNLGSVSDFKKLVHKSLLKIFIENEVNLQTLDIEVYIYDDNYGSYYEDTFELILQNPNFIHNIKNLELYFDNYNLIKNRVLQMINLHQNLKKIFLDRYSHPIFLKQLLLSKNYNCSNTLNTIIFYSVNFNRMDNLYIVFEQLNVLESVHIIYCHLFNTGFIQQIIYLTKPFKLKSLFISKSSRIDKSLLLLLQKSGCYLENFEYDFGISYDLTKQELLESIIKFCKNIKLLYLYDFENQVVHLIFKLIENIKRSLKYLSIGSNVKTESSSIILRNLGQILPFKLEYLNLILYFKASDFEIFLKNSQSNFIEKLVINNISNGMQEYNNDIVPYIKKYIMNEKRVKYLATIRSGKELFDLKDEVKEFKLYDIKVQCYDDLLINIYEFTKKLD
ncbi:hypothetical protein GLOIN_2v1780629 [Rhizophagus clarus]|nr:hypothetical protein GLOIN_2v1780629 [Rhizophagus clarus]